MFAYLQVFAVVWHRGLSHAHNVLPDDHIWNFVGSPWPANPQRAMTLLKIIIAAPVRFCLASALNTVAVCC